MTQTPALVDATQHSTVVVCRACGARDVATSRAVALRAAAWHYQLAHPELPAAAVQLTRRAAQLVATRPPRRG